MADQTTKTSPPAGRVLARTGDGTLVVSTGGVLSPDPAATVHVHFDFVVDVGGAGKLVGGWVADPGRRLAPLATAGGASLSLADNALGAKGADGRPAASYGFLGLVGTPGGGVGLALTLKLADGPGLDATAWPVGGIDDAVAAVAGAAFEVALAAVRRLVDQHHAAFGVDQVLSPPLVGLLEAFYQRIEAQPLEGASIGLPIAAYFDIAQRVGTIGILLKGWLIRVAQDSLVAVRLKSFFGRAVDVDLPLPASTRLDVVEAMATRVPGGNLDCGFITYAACPDVHPEDQYWFAELVTASGSLYRIPFRLAVATSPRRLAQEVAMWAEDTVIDANDLYRRALGPAISEIWRLALEQTPTPVVSVQGTLAAAPEVSIVVPLYGRIDFLRHQIVSFAADPDFSAAAGKVELIYVLDDPRKEREFRQLVKQVALIYDVPFKTVDLRGNYGYSTANNAGAAEARGRYLLLLNSDVIPKRPGWISQMIATADAIPDLGALGCRLLYEDDSIQHAGMEFRPADVVLPGGWLNVHAYKGLSVDFDPHNDLADVPAVTGACLFTPRALYEELGGLTTSYVIGDFEDSDYCLKARGAGRVIRYTPKIELYHMERQSIRTLGDGRFKLTLYNMWQHSERWKAEIAEITAAG